MSLRSKDKSKLFTSSKSGAADLIGKVATKSFLKGKLTAKRVVVPGQDVSTKTKVHPYNPRNKEGLTVEAVSDIYNSIKENGVSTEGIAVESPEGIYLVLDSSRRRFCCIDTNTDLPLWVLNGEPDHQDILALINDSQEVKRWSYREHAQYLITVAKLNGIDAEAVKIDELAKHLSIGRESLRKRLEALKIEHALLAVFPHYENIPNSYYQKLSKIQRSLIKAGSNITDDMGKFKERVKGLKLPDDLLELHQAVYSELESFVKELTGEKKPKQWKVDQLAEYDSKFTSASRKVSPDGRKHVYEFSRIDREKVNLIDEFIRKTLND